MEVLKLQFKPKTRPPQPTRILSAGKLEDLPEIERTAKGIIKILKKFGGYEPAADDIWVYRIANCTFYLKKSEYFLDAPTANEYTYARVTDIQTKQQNMIKIAMEQLALNRRDRKGQNREADLIMKLRETLEKEKNP
jgi:hypothetical protein